MSVVNYETGEIVEFDRGAAERRAERIVLRLDAIAENYARVLPMIREAIEKRDDLALGYRSPGDYVSDRFGDALSGLGIEVRRAVVGELTAAGLSTRAIAPVVGVSREAVRRDVEHLAGDNTVSPQCPEPATGGEAMTSSGNTSAEASSADDETWHCENCGGVDGDDGDPENCTCGEPDYERVALDAVKQAHVEHLANQRPPVTGIDGKTYTAKTQPTSRRRPLPDSFWTAVYDAEKRVQTLRNLTTDDRWTQNAEKVAAAHRNDLLRINDLLQQVINSLPDQEDTK